MSNRFYDVVIIGAGPAGLAAALETVHGGLKTLMLEKDPRVGQPLNCAEGVPGCSFEKVIPVRDAWIRSRINQGRLYAPSGKYCELPYKKAGYVIDRPKMEQDLADDFVVAGGELLLGYRAVGLRRNGDGFETLETVDDRDRRKTFRAGIFIAADGVESTIARLAGIDNRL
ncbi:MAG: NAD(P)/FAD-dependent oxidoreductase, partial [Candidatus Zixiibacteriota bacterium]